MQMIVPYILQLKALGDMKHTLDNSILIINTSFAWLYM